jgi:hypothetical protein
MATFTRSGDRAGLSPSERTCAALKSHPISAVSFLRCRRKWAVT